MLCDAKVRAIQAPLKPAPMMQTSAAVVIIATMKSEERVRSVVVVASCIGIVSYSS